MTSFTPAALARGKRVRHMGVEIRLAIAAVEGREPDLLLRAISECGK
jgi:hypothetical protein